MSELKLYKIRNIPEGELLKVKVTTFKKEMMKMIEEQGAEIIKLKTIN